MKEISDLKKRVEEQKIRDETEAQLTITLEAQKQEMDKLEKQKQTREKEIVFNENLDNLDTVNNQKSESDTADENLITKKQLNAELKEIKELINNQQLINQAEMKTEMNDMKAEIKAEMKVELKNFLEQVTKMLDDRLSPLLKCINQHGEAISQLTEILGEQK
ncbi:Hypothetical_protein [Hexamita inflata]|uniref:Hypothetical_protein n=1 Tax=Hexamita inflata TaxID=28002 RepID=A0AA86NIW8_9EUKA|nr:Hypothetical protein HINF_LOCUS7508 [Hexamita inflata]